MIVQQSLIITCNLFLSQHMNHVSLLFEVIVTVLSTTDLAWMYPTVDAVFVRMGN